jgi:predicted  nucleic acid-binding Zn-ribbon protein
MNAAIQTLLKLQALEFGQETGKSVESQIAGLRGEVPAPILGHYDRLRVRGKKGVAIVRNQVCTGCHMLQPIGKITVLMRGEDIQLCDTCGRYLYLPDPVEGEVAENVAAAKPVEVIVEKPAPKPRKRKERKVLATA